MRRTTFIIAVALLYASTAWAVALNTHWTGSTDFLSNSAKKAIGGGELAHYYFSATGDSPLIDLKGSGLSLALNTDIFNPTCAGAVEVRLYRCERPGADTTDECHEDCFDLDGNGTLDCGTTFDGVSDGRKGVDVAWYGAPTVFIRIDSADVGCASRVTLGQK